MIQYQRVSIDANQEVWHLHATTHKLFRLGEAHCSFDHPSKGAVIRVFVTDNCPRHRDLVDFFIDQAIPQDYQFMVEIFSRGMLVDSWNSLETSEFFDDGQTASDLIYHKTSSA